MRPCNPSCLPGSAKGLGILCSRRSGAPYTSLFKLNVLYLNHIDLATKEDEDNHLVEWANAFLADTWEALKEIANNNPSFQEVAETMYDIDSDVSLKSIAEAHDKYLHDLATHKKIAYLDGVEKGRKESREEIERLKQIIQKAGLAEE